MKRLLFLWVILMLSFSLMACQKRKTQIEDGTNSLSTKPNNSAVETAFTSTAFSTTLDVTSTYNTKRSTNVTTSKQTSSDFAYQKALFNNLYTLAEIQYQAEIDADIKAYEKEFDKWWEKRDDYIMQQALEERQLREKYANLGLLNSGSYNSAVNSLNRKYSQLIGDCNEHITELNEMISALEYEREHPDPNTVLAIVASNNGMTAEEVVEKYYKFMC